MSSGVIVGYDGSDCAKSALATAAEVAAAYGDKLIATFGYDVNPLGGNVPEFSRALREVATQRLQEAQQIVMASAPDVELEAVIVERAPAEGLAELARERDARVIVVGTRGEGPFRAALIGSTPHKLLQLADRPVLVVPETA
jgi:nucleotide-binding universal stress UspA family protein